MNEFTYYVLGKFGNRTPDKSEPWKREYHSVPFNGDLAEIKREFLRYISIHETKAGRPVMGGHVTGTRRPTEAEAREVVTEGAELGIYDDIEHHVLKVMTGNWYIIEYEIDKGWKKLWPTDHRDTMRTRLFYDDDLGVKIK